MSQKVLVGLFGVMFATALFMVVESGQAQQDAKSAAGGFTPVMPLESLMDEQDRHYEAIVELIRTPDQKDWKTKMQHQAFALAEMGNINAYHDEARKSEDYRTWAIELKEQSLRLAAAGREAKMDAVKELAKQINATCNACHDKYKKD